MYSPNTVDKMNAIAHRYRDVIYNSIKAVLNEPKFRNTGAGADSLVVEVKNGDSANSPDIKITFDDHLIVLNKRRIEWTRLPNMKPLLAWAATKKTGETQIKKLAFATAWQQKTNDTWKPKLWRKKSLSAVLKEMNELIKIAYDQAIEEDLQQATNV